LEESEREEKEGTSEQRSDQDSPDVGPVEPEQPRPATMTNLLQRLCCKYSGGWALIFQLTRGQPYRYTCSIKDTVYQRTHSFNRLLDAAQMEKGESFRKNRRILVKLKCLVTEFDNFNGRRCFSLVNSSLRPL
jgi:hypothetical protein